MNPIAILDNCFLSGNIRGAQLTDILFSAGQFTQQKLDEVVRADYEKNNYLLPFIASKDILVPKQVQEEMREYISSLNGGLSRGTLGEDWQKLDTKLAADYFAEMCAIEKLSKNLEPSKRITVVQRERETAYLTRINDLTSRKIPRSTVPDEKRLRRGTDNHIMSLAYALAHDTDVYVLTYDFRLIDIMCEFRAQLARDKQVELPKNYIFVPSGHFTVNVPHWATPYDPFGAFNERANNLRGQYGIDYGVSRRNQVRTA